MMKLPLLLLLAAAITAEPEAGEPKTSVFRRNIYDKGEPKSSGAYYSNNYNRYRRQFPGSSDDSSSAASGLSALSPLRGTGTSFGGSRKGGSRNLPSRANLPFPGLGGPDALLTAETTEGTVEDDASLVFRGSGSFPGFPTNRDRGGIGSSFGQPSKGGSRGRGSSPSEGTSNAFTFSGSSGGNPFAPPSSSSSSSSFGSLNNRGSFKTGTSALNAAPPSFTGALSPSNDVSPGNDGFPLPSGFSSSGGFPQPRGTSFGSSFPSPVNSRFPSPSSGSSFPGSSDPFPASGSSLAFPSPGGGSSFPGVIGGSSFPVPGSGSSFSVSGGSSGSYFPSPFRGAGSSVSFPSRTFPGSASGGANSFSIDASLIDALKGNPEFSNLGINLDELMGIEPTTTKPPRRIPSAEDRDKVFSGASSDVQGSGRPIQPQPLPQPLPKPQALSQTPAPPQRGLATRAINFVGGCGEEPEAPLNGILQCSSYAGCRARCERGYRFPGGESRLFVACENGEWEVRGAPWTTLPACEPECIPPCQNEGICLRPNECSCPDNFEGPQCEVARAAPAAVQECSDKPPTPMNSRIFCSREECIAKCHEKYQFEEGVSRLFFDCIEGDWVIRDERWTTVPDCKAICDPECINGGICLAPDICECTPDYRGDHCQYPITNCDAKSLGFNGGYNCSGEGMNFGCKLWCPAGVDFEFAAADVYTCDYATSRWSPLPIPECDYEAAFGSFSEGSIKFGESSVVSVVEAEAGSVVDHRPVRRRPGFCFTWSGMHYKSFDGRVYSFESDCPYTLLQDAALGTFSLNLIPARDCHLGHCSKTLKLFLEGDEYTLTKSQRGRPQLVYKDTTLAIPGHMNGVVTERVAHFVVVKLAGLGLTVKWDLEDVVVTEVTEVLWNRTAGLCGLLDGVEANDWAYADGSSETEMTTFLKAWEATTLGDRCTQPPVTRSPCAGTAVARTAAFFCAELVRDPRFEECRQLVDVMPFVEACKWDYCKCQGDQQQCACSSFSAFFRECTNRGGRVDGGWRTETLCPMDCGYEKEYMACMPAIEPRCGQASDTTDPEFCVEGCSCPPATVLLDGKCVAPNDCPCTYHNKTYGTGETIPNDCNTCTCVGGEWQCTGVKCGARCASVGDPHYTTFDGRRYDFMGKCSYYLVRGDDYSIVAENTPCAGAISEAMNFPASVISTFPSCTKSVTVTAGATVIKLKQDREVVVNGVEAKLLPLWVTDVYIKKASSLFVVVELPNGLDVWWDGQTRAYVDAPPELRDKVTGLCGTFTDNQRDDFLTPEGDVEQNHVAFANKWKISERCEDVPLLDETHPCDRHVQNKDAAEKYCAKIKSNLFADCHLTVDPEPYYSDCLYDLCSCEAGLGPCMCPIFSAYSKECARKGILLDWRGDIRECGVHCKGGQQYQICGDSCTHSCYDLATNPGCKKKCVEGCNCPEGFTLDATDTCVPMSQCPCVYLGKEYKAGYEMMQPDAEGQQKVCECVMAQWDCRQPTQNELESEQFFQLPQVGCLEDNHEVYSECMPDEEPTCKTMHFREDEKVSDTCKAGCRCAPGYVRDTDTGACVSGHECPCHHGGRSYAENDTIVEECNKCTCTGGEWECSTNECAGMCTAWGDSHYKTFDGKMFEFHGTCDYMLAKAKSKGADSFQVSIQNVPCGTNGVTCAKSITLRLGARDNQEVIEFSKDKPLPENTYSRTIIRQAGVFVFAEVPDMGLTLQWDRGTRAYLTLTPRWKGKVKGLCGNYNGDDQDDYQTPSGGTAEASARIFGDSWRLQNYCPESSVIEDTCALHPHRKVWATEKCAVLKSDVFAPCHSEVPVDSYVSRCQFDTCGCDTGGDCECLCTALAAYAHECNIHGVHVRWRTDELCPMQCDETCEHYEPCIPTCGADTCDTLLEPTSETCEDATCVEGCAKDVCPPGHVHKSVTDKECVPEADCDKKCLEVDGKVFMEGDVIEEDECHTCFCSRKKKVCRGSPCTTTTTSPLETTTHISTLIILPIEEDDSSTTETPPPTTLCRTGWTAWINRDHPIAFKKNSDDETLPERVVMTVPDKGYCTRDMYADIRCRKVGTHEPWDATRQAVTCDLPDGLHCKGRRSKGANPTDTCHDYEISLFCDCGMEVTTLTPEELVTPPPLVLPVTFPPTVPVPMECTEKWTPWMNRNTPDEFGEFETLSALREVESFCPDHYIKSVECRNADGSALYDFFKCDLNGATCRNNGDGSLQYCFDAEVRVLCQCECQDGLGMEDGTIPDSSISSSASESPDTKDTAYRARLNAAVRDVLNDEPFPVGAWKVPSTGQVDEHWLQVDLGERKEVTGVITQGSPFAPLFVSKFAVQVSPDGSKWQEIRDPDTDFAKPFVGNTDGYTAVKNLFPTPVMVQFVRVVPLTRSLGPAGGALRLELTGCDLPEEEEITTPPPGVTTTPPPLHVTVPKQPVCVDGWTPWMNSHTPTPGDWDDLENYSSLRLRYAFCSEDMIVGTECQVAVLGTPAQLAGQQSVVCSHNLGLQCVDELQAPQHCFDYEIRFKCDCSKTTLATLPSTYPSSEATTERSDLTTTPPDVELIGEPCDISKPAKLHARCDKFYECTPMSSTSGYLVEKSCQDTFFNPNTRTCDWPANVIPIRPECADTLPPEDSTLSPIVLTSAPTVPCEDGWTEWFNVSHPSEDGGDYETYEAIKTRHPGLCEATHITETQCQFNKITKVREPSRGRKGGRKGSRRPTQLERYTSTLLDFSESTDYYVRCDRYGLQCNNLDQNYGQTCQDYAVRFLCTCDPSAVSTSPLPPYTDSRFSSATPDEQMYNDWCPPGKTMQERAIPCARVCLYYGRVLAQAGHCLNPNDYAPACADDETGLVCPPGMFLRDKSSCVAIFECNCYLPNGLSAPPGKTFLVSDCEVCMCENNLLQCDTSACVTTSQPTVSSSLSPAPDLTTYPCNTYGPWLNEHQPDADGETESLQYLRTLYPDLCEKPSLIQCYTAADHKNWRVTNQNVNCDISTGLFCRNARNPGGCVDFKVRFYCLCPSTPEDTTTSTAVTTSPLPPLEGCFQPFWTEWFNASHPGDSDGDYELLDDIAAAGGDICPKAYIQDIECVYNKEIIVETGGASSSKGGRGGRARARKGRPMRLTSVRYEETDYTASDDVYVVCSRDIGLTCSNLQQPTRGRCHDYSIRVYCSCDPVPPVSEPPTIAPQLTTQSTPYPGWPAVGPTCELGKQALECAAPCDRVCAFYRDLLQRADTCLRDEDCAPACADPLQQSACPPGLYLQDNSTCVTADQCTCKLPSGQPLPAGSEYVVSDCETCKCVSNKLECVKSPKCEEETTVEPPVGVTTLPTVEAPKVTPTPTPTTPKVTSPPRPPVQIRCNEWTPWLNMKRNNQGDFQRIADLRQRDEFSDLCEKPVNVSCREANAKLPAAQLGQVLTCDTSEGLVCLNADNSQPCYDYEVAFFCACDESVTVTTSTPGIVTTPAPCNAWSPWINEQKPWISNGDAERKTLVQLRQEFGFCLEGELADIECDNTANGLSTPDKDTICDLRFGFQCKNEKQPKGACYDHRIRYYCSCETTPATTTVVMVPITPTPPSVCDPDDYVELLQEVEDSDFAASSSINPYFGPPQARLSDPAVLGWSPRTDVPNQYLQITLPGPRTLYGVTVAGSPTSPNAVEIFTLQVSDDGTLWSPIVEDPTEYPSPVVYFRGSSRGSNLPVTRLLPRPVETRMVRVTVLTWNIRPVLRLELIGCSLPTTTKKPTILEECDEPMGLESGEFSPLQLTVSSVMGDQPFYGKENVPLNTPARRLVSAGAWVPENRPGQYIRFDFLEPSKLSGIVTQGRDDQDEWIETFSVQYSPDGVNWNTVKDLTTGEDKVFFGNSDRRTPVENTFGRVLETRHLELRPLTWHGAPALRVEVKGCFHPYTRSPEETTTTSTPAYPTPPPPASCPACPQLPPFYYSACRPCRPGLYFDGTNCIPPAMCPCYKNGVKYQVGAIFETVDCRECKCEMGGTESCEKKTCAPCDAPEEHSVLTANCDCLCKPCSEGTRLCPSSNYCINSTQWCDGVENCLDDELDCPTTTTPVPEIPGCPTPSCPSDWSVVVKQEGDASRCPVYDCDPPLLTTPASCPPPACPLGYDIHLRPQKKGLCPLYDCVLPSTTPMAYTCPPPSCPAGYDVVTPAETYDYYDQQLTDADGCPQYKCATSAPPTAPCPMPQCQDGYEINFADTKELLKPCPAFECIPLVTTTVCPPVQCAPGLRTMFLSTSESGCPQYTCLKITTPAVVATPMPTVAPCPEVALPVCEPGEEFYQKNPNDPCPEFGCKPIGEPVPTTGAPQVASPECEMDGRAFNTFDGSDFKLDTCNHILARDRTNDDWLISVHRNCTKEGSCSRFLKVKQEEHQMVLNPDLTIEWDSASYSVSQMQKIGSQSKTFSVSRQGDSLYLQSLQHGFYVVWDVNMNLKIGVNDDLLYQVDGLCGFYTGDPSDDKTKPDGSPTTNTEEYGDSWTLGEDKCEETHCEPDTTATAFQLCNSIDAKPFSECHTAVPPSTFLQGCIERTCECLADGGAEEECKCAALGRYVTKCLTVDRNIPVQDWRVAARCYKECPPGERYSDCLDGCEKTCDSFKYDCPEVQSASCSGGCFCDPGLVRKDGRCVHPDLCGDCTCEGYGDPHYKSFDRRNFTFNGECSYVAARHKDPRGNHKFQVITHNKRCNKDPITMCTDSVKILHSEREVEVKLLPTGAILTLVEGAALSDFPYRDEHFAVERPDDKHVAVAVPSLHLEVTYSAENYGFTVTVPSHQFSNETEGLCGNCNGEPDDDFKLISGSQASSVEDFGLSWQVAVESPGVCEIFRKEDAPCLPLPPDEDPCLKIMDPEVFGQCHPLEDPVAYVSSCQQDVCLSTDPIQAACQSLSAYAKRCGQLGSCLQWNREDFCPVTCPEGQVYEVCGPGCVLTCDNYEEYEQNPDSCPFSSTDGCYCPNGQVLLNDTCVEKTQCTPCDEEGHREGDTWHTDTCTTCQCTKGRVLCTAKSCPQDPICDRGYNLIELPYAEDECCGPPKKCILAPQPECPPVKEPVEPCGHGKTYQLIQTGGCSEFACVCLAPEDCPPLESPDPAQLLPGEEWEVNDQGCCPRHVKVCTGECPELECQEFYELVTAPASEGACCPAQSCEPPKDACIYEPKSAPVPPPSKGVKGRPAKVTASPTKLKYQIGEAWQDGPCIECECAVDENNSPYHNCVRQTCTSLSDHPDRRDYELQTVNRTGQCCPDVIRSACIDDYDVIPVGDELDDPINGCRTVSCEMSDSGRVEKKEKIFSCDTSCADGWVYTPSPLYPQVCCGSCEQVACVHDGVVRRPDEEWTSDDFCIAYKCTQDAAKGSLETRATEVRCETPSAEERGIYTFLSSPRLDHCCPTYSRVGCLINGVELPAGKSLPDPEDPCITIECVAHSDGNVTRREKEQSCSSDCSPGSTYYDPPAGSSTCCGRCIQTHCVDRGRLQEVGSSWENPDDACYQYTCVMRDDVLTTVAEKRDCPYFNPECPPEEVYFDDTGCCKLCNVTVVPKRDCAPVPMNPKDTIGMFAMQNRNLGVCSNTDPVPLNICQGHCESSTLYRMRGIIPQLENECYCCQPSDYEEIAVRLYCNPGFFNIRRYNIKSCACIPCSQEQALKDQPIVEKTEFYSGPEESVQN